MRPRQTRCSASTFLTVQPSVNPPFSSRSGHQEGHHREGRPGGGDQVRRRPAGAGQEDPGRVHQRTQAAPETVQVLEAQGQATG